MKILVLYYLVYSSNHFFIQNIYFPINKYFFDRLTAILLKTNLKIIVKNILNKPQYVFEHVLKFLF